MKFEIAKSKKQGKIYFLARDVNGNVRLRDQSLPQLQKSIAEYELPAVDDHARTKQRVTKEELRAARQEAAKQVVEDLTHPKKTFDNKLRAELAKRAEAKLKEQVLARKAALSKSS